MLKRKAVIEAHRSGKRAKRSGAVTAHKAVVQAINRAVGFNRSRAMIPAIMRARSGTGATELKSVDTTNSAGQFTQYGFGTNGTTQLVLNPPIEGAGFYNRIARRTRGVSLEIRGHITPTVNNANIVADQFARVMILYDRQMNGAVPAVTTVLLDYNNNGATTTTSFSGLNMDYRDRFLVLRDRKIKLPGMGVNGAPTTALTSIYQGDLKDGLMVYHEFIRLNGLETQYKASAGSQGDIATGGFVILLISEADAGNPAPGANANPTTAWKLEYQARFKFYD